MVPRFFESIGECIYCGDANAELSDEHIVPYGLAGDQVFRSASCPRCARITSAVERSVLRLMLGDFRLTHGYPTRRPKERPERLGIQYVDSEGRVADETVPVADFPNICTGFRFPDPGILVGRPEGSPIEADIAVHAFLPQLERLARPGEQVSVPLRFNTLKFMRMLAKIAHGYALGVTGAGAFRPFLRDLILGESEDAGRFVGCDRDRQSHDRIDAVHDLYLEALSHDSKPELLVASIRLFAYLGMPAYRVVVGEVLQPSKPAGQ